MLFCGNNGYEELLKQNIPLPSLRTLRRRLQNLKFSTGILHEVFKFLRIKIYAIGYGTQRRYDHR